MNTQGNLQQDLTIDAGAYKLGEHMFQSFLLAGERFLNSGFAREGTDEVRFAEFYNDLAFEQRELLQGYFKRQGSLDVVQRMGILNDMVPLQIQQPLTLESTRRFIETAPSVRPALQMLADWQVEAPQILENMSQQTLNTHEAAGRFNRLSLRLEEIRVADSQDMVGRGIFSVNKNDEVSLGIVTIDETGFVKRHSHNLGQIRHRRTKTFNDMRLVDFNLEEGGRNNWPKTYTVQIYAIERDNGGYNNMLDRAANFVRKKVDEEMIAAGINTITRGLIPAHIARIVSNAIKGFLDKLIDWLADLLRNSDDVLGQKSRVVTLNSFNDGWGPRNESSRSDTWAWTFSGADGRWITRMHWQLENSSASES